MSMSGTDLRTLRKSMGFTQGQLAQELGLTQGFIGEMERGEKAVEKRTQLALMELRAQRDERVSEHGFHVAYASRVAGWNVVFTHAGWRSLFGNRQVVLYGHFSRQRYADRWARALEAAGKPRMQRRLHEIVDAAVAKAA